MPERREEEKGRLTPARRIGPIGKTHTFEGKEKKKKREMTQIYFPNRKSNWRYTSHARGMKEYEKLF